MSNLFQGFGGQEKDRHKVSTWQCRVLVAPLSPSTEVCFISHSPINRVKALGIVGLVFRDLLAPWFRAEPCHGLLNNCLYYLGGSLL